MALVTIIEAAKLTGKSTPTLYRHIKAGKLSKSDNGMVDTAELIRCYGELKQFDNSQLSLNASDKPQNENDVIAILQQQVSKLENEITELKTDAKHAKAEALKREEQALERERLANEREARIMALLEHQAGAADKSGGLFGKWFK